MRIHHLNCATMCPPAARLVHGTGGWLTPGRMVCHCLLIESPDGLILVDTGLGLETLRASASLLNPVFRLIASPRLSARMARPASVSLGRAVPERANRVTPS